MGTTRKGSLRHRLQRLCRCSNASPSNRFLHEKDSLAFSPSYKEPSRVGTHEKSPPVNLLTMSIRDPPHPSTSTTGGTTSTKMNATWKSTKSMSPARSVHSAVTEVWSNAARRPSSSAPTAWLSHTTTSGSSFRPVAHPVGSGTTFDPSHPGNQVVINKSAENPMPTTHQHTNMFSLSDDDWNVLSSTHDLKS